MADRIVTFVKRMPVTAGVLLAASLAAGEAAAEISLSAVRIAQGDLWVIGDTEAHTRVTLDERFEQTTDGRGRFEFRVVYHPATCIVTLKTPTEQRLAVVQGCGQTGPRGEAGPAGPQGPAGPPGPQGPRGTVETVEVQPPAPAPARPLPAPVPPATPPARPTETARLPDPAAPVAPPRAAPEAPRPAAPAAPPPPAAPPGPPVLGEWLVEDGAARIAIQPCGPNVCGSVSWSKEGGELGTQILRAMKPAGPNRWEGTIYDPTSGRSYSSNISLRSADSLRVEGCVLGVLCGGQTWTRAK